jgi:ribosomal protein S18 acetylase RimI-like enzyme
VNDLQRVMRFLRDTYAETGSLGNWLPPRFENSAEGNEADIRVWEEEGRIVAVANPEDRRRYFLQVHPDYSGLEGEMLDWTEGHAGGGLLSIVSLEGNPIREELLKRRGYERGKIEGILRLHDPEAPIPVCPLPDGYKIRSINPSRDFKELAAAVRTVFGHGEWFNEEVLRKLAQASFYREELDLVADDATGAIASFCTFRLDASGGFVELEPMGTLPKYQGLGLAKALICEGLRRLRRYDPKLVYIGGAANNPAANRLYDSTGFTIRHDFYYWNKTI